MTEVEWKLALEPSEYRRLVIAVGAVGNHRTRRTKNLYWETTDHALRRAGCGLRLRRSPGRPAILTFKYKESSSGRSGGVHRRGEVECRVSALTARRLHQGKISPLKLRNVVGIRARAVLGSVDLSPLGELSLERRRARWNDLVLEIDRFSVHGVTYHEVEIEHSDPAHVLRSLRPFFRENGIRWRPKAATKVSYLYRKASLMQPSPRRAGETSRRRSVRGTT